jgi:hypothetical protein
MNLDRALQFASDQALTATAVSTSVIDLSVDRNIGKGEPMGAVITVGVAADVADADETYQFVLQSSATEAFTVAFDNMTTQVFDGTTLTEGASVVIPVPHNNLQYLRLNNVLGGTTPTVTVSAYLQPMSMIDGYDAYASGYTII